MIGPTTMNKLCLQLVAKYLNKHLSEGYSFTMLDEAMHFHLKGTLLVQSAATIPNTLSAPAAIPTTLMPSISIKSEDVGCLVDLLT